MSTVKSIHEMCTQEDIPIEDLAYILSLEDQSLIEDVFTIARQITDSCIGKKIYLRGLIEVSNICRKNCYYCGIRRDNKNVNRYTLSYEDVIQAIQYSYESGFGSIVLQAGEQTSKEFVSFITKCILYAKKISKGEIGITLSLGEQTKEMYREWFDAGAERYLLRIETSDPELYSKLHPEDHSYDNRLRCLYALKEIGYQVGTGVMIGLPYQTINHLAQDILFYKKMDVDMIGMGPYILHPDTPLISYINNYNKEQIKRLSLLMIALTRIVCKDVNIASTTALEVLDSNILIKSFYAGANVKMIDVTPQSYKRFYDLYEGKVDASNVSDFKKFVIKVQQAGFEIQYHTKGNPMHYYNRRNINCQ